MGVQLEGKVIDTMRQRQSVRTYHDVALTEEHIKNIENYIEEIPRISPFGKIGNIEFIEVTSNRSEKGVKLGTYGFIKSQKGYLVGISEKDTYSLVKFAYNFQMLVLYLTELGLGTCWMGGTFSRKSFEKELIVSEGEFIPCVTPVGYPREKRRLFDKAIRAVAKSDNRKAWENLFFDESFHSSLSKDNAGQLELPLEMVRIGPSASNKQPWRLVVSKDRRQVHFYIEHTPNYSSSLGYDMQLLDIGIAMCQFDLACKELQLAGEWVVENPGMNVNNEQIEYLYTWKSR
ncbi:nitroreductase family protein [Evansella cellulosilytica]|uniref:nitroreductase family protein n=1 Tax=Evansella cellulosilytica TaxID=1413 RepID=UPI0005A213CE